MQDLPNEGEAPAAAQKKQKPNFVMALQLKKSLHLIKTEEAPASPMIKATKYSPNRIEILNYYETQVTEFSNVHQGAFSFTYNIPEFQGTSKISEDWTQQMKTCVNDCCVNYDFMDKNRAYEIERKRKNLYEILEWVQKTKDLSESQVRDIFVLLKYNLIRNFFDRNNLDLIEDEDNIRDIAWTHIWVSYQILTEVCYSKNSQNVRKYLTDSFIDQIMYNLKSLDRRERTMVVDLIQMIYENFETVRVQVMRTTQNILMSIIYENFTFIGTKELITIVLSFPIVTIDNLSSEQSCFLFNVLLPFHGYKKVTQCLDQLIDVMINYVQDDDRYLVPIINKVSRFSKIQSIDEQRGFIVEMEELVKRCSDKKIKEIDENVFLKIIKCLTSFNKDVVSESVKLLNTSKLSQRVKGSESLRSKALSNLLWVKSYYPKIDCLSEIASFQKKLIVRHGTIRKFSFKPSGIELGVPHNPLRDTKSQSMIMLSNKSHLDLPVVNPGLRSPDGTGSEKKTKFKTAVNALNALKKMLAKN